MKIRKSFHYITIIFVIIVIWQLFIFINNYFLNVGSTSIEAFVPSPYTVFNTLITKRNVLFTELGYTLSKAVLGLFLGVFLSIIINMLFFIKPILKTYILPMSMAINSFPIIGFSPLIILAFGQGSWLGIVFVSALISYFPILISMDKALSLNTKEFNELGKVWKATKMNIFTYIQIPLVVPYVIGSLKMAIPASIVGATLGEWLGANHGIGKLVIVSLYQLNPGLLYSSLILLLVSSLFITWISTQVEKKFFPWIEQE